MNLKNFIKKRIGSENLYIIRRYRKIYFCNYNEIFDNDNPSIFLLGTPVHTNLGDQAIAIAEMQMLKRLLPNTKVFEIAENDLDSVFGKTFKSIGSNDLILLHGGGNMGNRYLEREIQRRLIIKKFPNNKIIFFPQTIDFDDNVEGRIELERSRKIYSRHKDLVIFARETESYETMKKFFSNNSVMLAPDIVLQMNSDSQHTQEVRKGALMCFRNDGERMLTNEDHLTIQSVILKKFGENFELTDTVISDPKLKITKDTRDDYVREKLVQFKKVEVVLTDRLHGMVFAFLTGTPCVVFGNNNHKVLGVYQWISKNRNICFCSNINNLVNCIDSVLENKPDNHERSRIKNLYSDLEHEIIISIGE
jgi:pyruvyl transferase EpsI